MPTDVPVPTDLSAPTADLALRGTAVLEQGLVPDALVLCAGERILWAGPAAHAPAELLPEDSRVLEHDGLILPGLVDLHCHGGGGASFPDSEGAEEMLAAVLEHRRHGTTSLVASLVTADAATLREKVAQLAGLHRDGEIAAIHLEGPFLSEARRGAQNPAHLTDGDPALVRELAEIAGGALATMTVAPEAAGADEVIDALAGSGAVPSLGHTDGGSAEMTRAVDRSIAALRRRRGRSPLPTATHLFNGMRPIHHRDPGPALAALDAASRGEMVVEVIADGVHLDARTVAHIFSIAAEDSVVLVTDAMAAAGMADGRYRLGALDVTVEEGVATLTEGGAIAGGTAHLVDVLRLAVLEAGVELVAAVRAASTVPARVLGLEDEIGSLAAGRRADVLMVDRALRPVTVLRGGREV
ncbi:N-acetylglucosamine-6-phosphate deacetylase [Brachybacterium paraconglomeratum]|uniref:N-acetylglucosamine-6-phosphate deacetylase n=1 Tax=Brachybacterium paraconglomeratum TaxID=173362 RepID=UPI0021A405D7|nr:amidohydrolase family protein [Brachybacterium paraconglomeratum]MCT1909345.1 amidohydrolase family protein [Brachybacterium paraconglomeratum]